MLYPIELRVHARYRAEESTEGVTRNKARIQVLGNPSVRSGLGDDRLQVDPQDVISGVQRFEDRGQVSDRPVGGRDRGERASQELDEPVTSGQLIINLRAEADPSVLAESIEQAVANLPVQFPGLTTKIDHLEHFKPGRPTPTHRLEKA